MNAGQGRAADADRLADRLADLLAYPRAVFAGEIWRSSKAT